MKPSYLHVMIVAGAGTFPLDMLRYDHCWPETSGDVEILHASITRDQNQYLLRVVNESWQKDPMKAYTIARWESFGATIKHWETRKL